MSLLVPLLEFNLNDLVSDLAEIDSRLTLH